MNELIYKEESYAIVGAALEVYNHLGTGFLESVYQEAMEMELSDRHIPFVSQQELFLKYRGRQMRKTYIPDFVAFGKIIIELKAQTVLTAVESAQAVNYLKATALFSVSEGELAILINFGHAEKVEFKRLFRASKLGTTGHTINTHNNEQNSISE